MTTVNPTAVSPSAPPQDRRLERRVARWIIPVLVGLNGLAMLVAGPLWYATTPEVDQTGPYNAPRLGRSVAADDPAMEEYRARLQQHYGAALVTALAFEIGMARFHPSLKRALGVARSCALVTVTVADG